MDTSRIVVRDAQDAYLFDIAPSEVFSRKRTEELNGARSLDVETTRRLEQGWRLLTVDATGKWREYVVVSGEQDRFSDKYRCVWSLQHDLLGVTCEAMPGTRTPATATEALTALLANTSRWTVGTVDVATTGGASFYNLSAYKALGVLVDVWGGEVDAEITVGTDGTVTRRVALRSHLGASQAVRRFDYGSDLTGIRRKVVESPAYCRIKPLGRGEETEGGGYGRKITIESVNDGKDYLENSQTAPLRRLPKPGGGWEYPTVIVENAEMETPADLKAWAEGVLDQYTTPKVSYSADVVQLAEAGMDAHGVGLGDECQCVDRGFGGDGLRISGRIVKITVDELDPASGTAVTIGNATETIASKFKALGSKLDRTAAAVDDLEMTTQEYFDNIVDNLNSAINATGGYTYVTEGQGIRTYDRAVTDPLVGTEATKVVEVKGGSIRIADSKTPQGEWNWRTVFISGHVAAELVTAVQITAGYIGSRASGNYINLDTGELILDTIRQYGDGALVCRPGNTIGALVNADGSFDVVAVTWNGNTPTVGTLYASYGPTAQIGKVGESHIEMDYHSLKLIDKEGDTYFHASDLRDTTGYATIVETFTGDGSNKVFDLGLVASAPTGTQAVTAKINGTTTTAFTASTVQTGQNPAWVHTKVTFTTAPANNATVVITYTTNSQTSKAYTFGNRSGNTGATSVALGNDVQADGAYSVAEGYKTRAGHIGTHAEGFGTKALWQADHAEGLRTTADGGGAHAEGEQTAAKAYGAHAEGYKTTASGSESHAEGSSTTASGGSSHAEGGSTTASGIRSHAGGYSSTASGTNSFAHGEGLVASAQDQAVFGKFNAEDSDALLLVGGGSSNSSRKNVFKVTSGGIVAGGTSLDFSAATNIALDADRWLLAIGFTSANRTATSSVTATSGITITSFASSHVPYHTSMMVTFKSTSAMSQNNSVRVGTAITGASLRPWSTFGGYSRRGFCEITTGGVITFYPFEAIAANTAVTIYFDFATA